MTPQQSPIASGGTHYDQNTHFTACGSPISQLPGGKIGHAYYDHAAVTNVESRVRCVTCREWVASYRAAFPRGETFPTLEELVTQRQQTSEAAFLERQDRRDRYATRESEWKNKQNAFGLQVKAR